MAREPLCPWCGAYSPNLCEMEDEVGTCLWEDGDLDPDLLRDDRDERRRLEKEHPTHD